MFPVPESNWMGDFAISVAIGHQIGAARGDRSILSAMDISQDELFAILGRSINDLILGHRKDLEKKRKMTRPPSEPKMRWVDGTPEYSLHIYALRRLFPKALFIHIVRNAQDVVRSMLNFHRLAGFRLVENEEAAYKCWLRMVRACVQAENAYGPRVVKRLLYSTLVNDPKSAMHSLLEFVGESYCTKCLEPLGRRINSSNVPPDFVADDPATDPAMVEEATRLYSELEQNPQAAESSPAATTEMQAAFNERVKYVASLNSEYQRALQVIAALQKEADQRAAGCIDRQSDSKTEQARSTACAAREVRGS